MAQTTINYNNSSRPAGDAAMEAAANLMTRRNPSNDFLFSNVRNAEVTVDWKNASGSPYLNESFSPCKLYMDKEQLGNFYYRYNAYSDEIELKESLSSPQISSLVQNKQFRLIDGSNNYTYNTIISKKNKQSEGHLNLLEDGEHFSLFRKDFVTFKRGAPAANSMVKATPDKFTNFTEYYYLDKSSGDDQAYYLDNNLKNFLNSQKKNEKEKIKTIIKEQKLNTKKEAELILLFRLLNNR
ncbi:hypothetical protein SB49_08845 [Sediminicola sp. YIK13]|nr:hypothetical protein SB49_08845 [Sediminicola sp. YIK13]